MGDVTTIFILETLELYRWTNDLNFLKDMYSHVVAGINWQISVSSQLGLPEHLECTYDIPNMSQYSTTTFNSFMYLAALHASMELASIMNDTITHNKSYESLLIAIKQRRCVELICFRPKKSGPGFSITMIRIHPLLFFTGLILTFPNFIFSTLWSPRAIEEKFLSAISYFLLWICRTCYAD